MKKLVFFILCVAMLGCDHGTQQQNETTMNWYDGFDAGIHTVYVGEVIGAWKR